MKRNRLRVGGWVERYDARHAGNRPASELEQPGWDVYGDSQEFPADAAYYEVMDANPELPAPYGAEPYGDQTLDLLAAEPPSGRRRAAALFGWANRVLGRRRVAVIAVTVGGLLIGAGVTIGARDREPVGLTAPPTPPELVVSSPTPAGPQLGAEPPRVSPSAPPGSSDPAAATSTPDDRSSPTTAAAILAADAELGSHAQVVSLPGGDAVRLGGQSGGAFVRFTGVSVATSGSYQLTIFYATEQSRTGAVSVNDGSGQPVSFPALEAGSFGSVSVEVNLVSGANSIVVASGGGPPLVVDGITVAAG